MGTGNKPSDTTGEEKLLNKGALEREWASYEARLHLPSQDRADWDTLRFTTRPFAYYDKIFVAWHVHKGEPHVKDILTVVGLDASFREGLWVRLQSEVRKQEFIVSHRPRRLFDLNVFAWIPFFNELRYVSADWNDPAASRNLRLSMCFKMRHKYEEMLEEGVDYLSELHNFRSRWPQYRDTRF